MCGRHTGVRESHLFCSGSPKVGGWWYVRSYAAGGADAVCRGAGQRGLGRSWWCNDCKVSQHGRTTAIAKFSGKLQSDRALRDALRTQTSGSLPPGPELSRSVLVAEFRSQFPEAYDRDDEKATRTRARHRTKVFLMRARSGRASVRQWKLVQDTRHDPCVTDSLLHLQAGGRQNAGGIGERGVALVLQTLDGLLQQGLHRSCF